MAVLNSYKSIENWVREIFRIPENALIEISEECDDNSQVNAQSMTKISVKMDNMIVNEYKILKPLSEIVYSDILFLNKAIKSYTLQKHPILARLFRLFGWWFIFAGAISAFSVCPVCGQVGCPIGIGTTGILAGFLALLKQNGKQFIIFIKTRLFSAKSKIKYNTR